MIGTNRIGKSLTNVSVIIILFIGGREVDLQPESIFYIKKYYFACTKPTFKLFSDFRGVAIKNKVLGFVLW